VGGDVGPRLSSTYSLRQRLAGDRGSRIRHVEAAGSIEWHWRIDGPAEHFIGNAIGCIGQVPDEILEAVLVIRRRRNEARLDDLPDDERLSAAIRPCPTSDECSCWLRRPTV